MDRIANPASAGQCATLHISKLVGGWPRAIVTDRPPELRPMAGAAKAAIEGMRSWRGAGHVTLILYADGDRQWIHDPTRLGGVASMLEWQAIADRGIARALAALADPAADRGQAAHGKKERGDG